MAEPGSAIRTPDQRLRVFISSTLGELAPERQAAREAVERLRLAPVMFELGARPHPPRALYRSYLEQSDVFVGIYWQRYGWVAPDMAISGLEDEFLLSDGMPRLIYVKRPADEIEPRLADLLHQLEGESTASYRPFRDAEELRDLVTDDLALMLTERFDATAAPVAAPVPTSNLPAPASTFVGRGPLLAEVSALLRADDVRLVTLTGAGGTGKTRLALESARASLGHFPDGVFLVDLTEERDAQGAYAAILRAVPTGKHAEELPLDALKAALAARELLVVLDNFEQVTAAAVGVVELLERCRGLKALATSRVALHVRPERRVAVPPLQVPGDDSSGHGATDQEAEAVQLFVERAKAVDPTFGLTDGNRADVAAICRRLDGLPLAIELAAARISLFAADELRERVSQQLSVLGRGGSDMPERQQTLRRTLEWSNELLEPAEQTMFRLFSLFFDARLADVEATVAGLGAAAGLDVVDGVGSLVDNSLVHGVVRADGRPRFTMLQTIRDFAAAELAADPDLAAAARRAHAEHYSAVAARITASSDHPDRNAALTTLSSDLGNLRAAWAYWVETGDVPRLNDLLQPLWWFYESRGNYRAAIELGEGLLAVLRRQPLSPECTRDELALEMSLAQSLIAVGGYSPAVERRIRDVLAQAEATGDTPHRFPALRTLATLYMLRDDFARSAAVVPHLLRIAQEQQDPMLLAEAYLMKAVNTLAAEGPGDALSDIEQAVTYSRTAAPAVLRLRVGPDPAVVSNAVAGLMSWMAGYPEQADARAARALALAKEADHPYSTCYCLFHTSLLALWNEDLGRVGSGADALLEVAVASEYPVWRALAHVLRGTVAVAAGDVDAGLSQVDEGFTLYRGLSAPPVFWIPLTAIRAVATLMAGRADDALALIAALNTEASNPDALGIEVVRGDALLARPSPDPDAAAQAYRCAADGSRDTGLRMVELQAMTRLTSLLRDTPDHAAAAHRLRAVIASFTEGFESPQYTAGLAALDL